MIAKLLVQHCCGALIGVVLLSPAVAIAQTPAETFADVPRLVETGRKVIVTATDGRKTQGTVAEITQTSMTLLVRDRLGTGRRQVFTADSVLAINRTDSVWNGLLIGLGAGIVGAELFVRHNCGPRGYDDECAAIATVVGWGTFVPGGAVMGALIDKFSGNRLLYRTAAERASVSIAPALGPGHGGIRIAVRF